MSDKTTPRYQLPQGQLAEMMLDAAVHVIRVYRQMPPEMRTSVDELMDTVSPADDADTIQMSRTTLLEAFFGGDPPKPPGNVVELRDFKVAAVSSNANAFGLHRFVFVAWDGSAFQACGNGLRVEAHPVKSVIELRIGHEEAGLTRLGFELPEPMPETTISARGRAPDAIVNEVWS